MNVTKWQYLGALVVCVFPVISSNGSTKCQAFPCHFIKGFRSLYDYCFFGTYSPANVLRAFSATPLTIPAPGKENRHFVVHSPYVVCLSGRGRAWMPAGRPHPPPPASLRADPGSRQRLIDFHAGPMAPLRFSALQVNSFRCKKSKPQRWSGVDGSG